MSQKKILLGFEVETGEPVYLPFHHAGFTGMTGKAGKTTAIEATATRSGYRTVSFITKRGEKAFANAHLISLFFKERFDWRYVESLIEAELREDQRFNRAWIIKVCRGAKSLRDVWNKVKEALQKVRKDSLSERVYTCLNAYFELIIPELEKYEFSRTLEVGTEPANYVMNLTGMSTTTQAVIIRSVLEEIYEKEREMIPTLPEAWKFVGATHTPVTDIAIKIIKEGYAVDIFLYIDSQDIASINPKIRGQIDNWILGRQRYEHEIDRTLKAIPVKIKPTRTQIQTLKLGHFYVACEDWCKHVYAWALGVPEEVARKVALGELKPEYVQDHFLKSSKVQENDEMWKEKYEKLEEDFHKLQKELEKIETESEGLKKRLEELEGAEKAIEEYRKLIQKQGKELEELRPLKKLRDALVAVLPKPEVQDRLVAPQQRHGLDEMVVSKQQPKLRVEIPHQILKLSQSDLLGRIAIVYAEGLLPSDKAFTVKHLNLIMEQRFGRKEIYADFPKTLTNLVAWGFFEKVRAGKRWDYRLKMKPEEAKEKGLLITAVSKGVQA